MYDELQYYYNEFLCFSVLVQNRVENNEALKYLNVCLFDEIAKSE